MIIWVNGSINSGKSTVSKILADKLGNCAIVELDKFREMIEWMPVDKAIPLNLKNAISSIKIFAEEGLNVIVPYPLSQKNYEGINPELEKLKTKLFYVTLSPRLEVVRKDRGERKLDDWERDRIKYHYQIEIHKPKFGKIIDNSNETPEETVKKILEIIKINQYGNS